jgi:hypothetical protein
VFDPIKAAIARASTSSNPAVQQTAQVAAGAVNQIAKDVDTTSLSSNSAAGLGNKLIGDFENGLNDTVSTLAAALIGDIPVVGGFIAAEAKPQIGAALVFAEQHAFNYIAALFAHHKTAVDAAPQGAQLNSGQMVNTGVSAASSRPGTMTPIPNP